VKPIILSALFALAIAFPATSRDTNKSNEAVATSVKKFKDADVEKVDKMRADKKNVLLDVRTPEEFNRGHIPGAINLNWNSPEFAQKAGELDKSKTYLVNCAGGGRSAKACAKLKEMDFTDCYNLTGGFSAWTKAGKPVER
jgi:rhodanese-related sulfurtransferase